MGQAWDGCRKGELSKEEAVYDSGKAIAGCAAGVAVASSSTLAAGCSAAAVAVFAVEATGAVAVATGVVVPALLMAPAVYFGRKIFQFLWRKCRGNPTEKKLRGELKTLCEKYNVKTDCKGEELKKAYRKESRSRHPDRAAVLKKSKEELERAFVQLTEDFDRIRKLRDQLAIPDTPTDTDFYTAVIDIWRNGIDRVFGEGTPLGRLFRRAGVRVKCAPGPAQSQTV